MLHVVLMKARPQRHKHTSPNSQPQAIKIAHFSGTLMEPSKILSTKEEYSSNVSGWTMYIGSPEQENDNYDGDDDDENDQTIYHQGDKYNKGNSGYEYDDANDKSDDSMASDASSGPSHHELPWGSSRKSAFDKHATSKFSSKEKLHKQKNKKDQRKLKVERDESFLKAKGAPTQARSGAKVRKTN